MLFEGADSSDPIVSRTAVYRRAAVAPPQPGPAGAWYGVKADAASARARSAGGGRSRSSSRNGRDSSRISSPIEPAGGICIAGALRLAQGSGTLASGDAMAAGSEPQWTVSRSPTRSSTSIARRDLHRGRPLEAGLIDAMPLVTPIGCRASRSNDQDECERIYFIGAATPRPTGSSHSRPGIKGTPF